MEDKARDLDAAQECVESALNSFQEQKHEVAAVTCAIASAKMQMKIIKLLNEINNNLIAIKEK